MNPQPATRTNPTAYTIRIRRDDLGFVVQSIGPGEPIPEWLELWKIIEAADYLMRYSWDKCDVGKQTYHHAKLRAYMVRAIAGGLNA